MNWADYTVENVYHKNKINVYRAKCTLQYTVYST